MLACTRDLWLTKGSITSKLYAALEIENGVLEIEDAVLEIENGVPEFDDAVLEIEDAVLKIRLRRLWLAKGSITSKLYALSKSKTPFSKFDYAAKFETAVVYVDDGVVEKTVSRPPSSK